VYDIMSIKTDIKNLYLKIKWQAEIEGSMPIMVIGDKSRMQQVLINLLSNAISHTYEGGVNINISYCRYK
jgi:signal transduction histidine kinase